MIETEPILSDDGIFVVGYPRSGTTLVQSLITALATDPEVVSFPETHYFNVIEKSLSPEQDGRVAIDAVRTHLDLIRLKTGLDLTETELSPLRSAADGGRIDSRAVFEWIIKANLRRRTDSAPLKRRPFHWLEKTPYHANFLERILTLFPRARAVHVVRHPVAAVLSRQRNFPFNRDTPLEELARHWDHMLANVERAQARFPDRVISIHYESLVTHLSQAVTRLQPFLGVTLDMTHINRRKETAAAVRLPGEPWKENTEKAELFNANQAYLDHIEAGTLARIEGITSERMAAWGYACFTAAKNHGKKR